MMDASKTNIKKTCAAKCVSVLLRHPIAKQVGGGAQGDKQVHARAFPGIVSAWKLPPGELLVNINPRLAVEKGAKANLGRAVERRRNAGPGTALEAQYATGIAVDRFMQVKECAVEPVTAAEGDVQAGASTASGCACCRVPGDAGPFCLLNEKST